MFSRGLFSRHNQSSIWPGFVMLAPTMFLRAKLRRAFFLGPTTWAFFPMECYDPNPPQNCWKNPCALSQSHQLSVQGLPINGPKRQVVTRFERNTAPEWIVGKLVSKVHFHIRFLRGFLFTFSPHGYLFTIDLGVVFSLGWWSTHIQSRFLVSRPTRKEST